MIGKTSAALAVQAPGLWSRVSAWFSPSAPVAQLPAPTGQKRSYDGAKSSRLNADWYAPGTGANTENQGALLPLRNRSRDLVRNNPYAAKGIASMVHNIVGQGILPTCTHENPEVRKKVNQLFSLWATQCSVADDLTFAGLQSLAVRSWLESGEVLLRRRWRRPEDGLAVPMQVQILESDFLNSSQNQILPTGGRIVQGVEFDPIDRRAAYWLWQTHPGDFMLGQFFKVGVSRVEAKDIAHIFEPLRPGQVRGVPWVSPVINTLRHLDRYDEAERIRKRTEACIAGFVTPGDEATYSDATDGISDAGAYDSDGNVLDTIEPGMIAVLRNGKSITFPTPGQNSTYPEYQRVQLRAVAAGMRQPYELLTGDLSQVNYSSYRAGWIDFKRQVNMLQEQIVIPLACAPVWRWFIEAAIAGGELPVGDYPVTWTPPKFEEIDPLKASEASASRVRNGLASQQDEIKAAGDNPDDVLAETVAWLEACDKAGVSFDSDPRKPAGGGAPMVPSANSDAPIVPPA